jgi:hypothetical protein
LFLKSDKPSYLVYLDAGILKSAIQKRVAPGVAAKATATELPISD